MYNPYNPYESIVSIVQYLQSLDRNVCTDIFFSLIKRGKLTFGKIKEKFGKCYEICENDKNVRKVRKMLGNGRKNKFFPKLEKIYINLLEIMETVRKWWKK